MNKSITFAFTTILLAALACWWIFHARPNPAPAAATSSTTLATDTSNQWPKHGLRLGIIPERDVFQQRRAYRLLADYLVAHQVAPTIELRTSSSYAGALQDIQDGEIDVAFVGSLVAALAQDRCAAQVLLKSEIPTGTALYAGIVFVRQDSPAQTFADLTGKRIGGVKTTTAGAVYPLFLIRQLGWEARDVPTLVWAGTHDDVLAEVAAGTLDAGAVKDARYDAYLAAHPDARFRKLSQSPGVPNNALVARPDVPAALRDKLVHTLLAMPDDPAAATVLAALDIKRFAPTSLAEYAPLYDMIEKIGPLWFAMEIGPAPHRPPDAAAPAESAASAPPTTPAPLAATAPRPLAGDGGNK